MGTFSRTLTIPYWIAPGRYYIGYTVDYEGYVFENNESNNSQQIPRVITIY